MQQIFIFGPTADEEGAGMAKPGSSQDPTWRSRRASGTPIDFWQVMGLEHGNRRQKAGCIIACVAQEGNPAWLVYPYSFFSIHLDTKNYFRKLSRFCKVFSIQLDDKIAPRQLGELPNLFIIPEVLKIYYTKTSPFSYNCDPR